MKKLFIAAGIAGLFATLLTGCAPASKIVPNTVISIGQDAPASSLNATSLADEATQDSNSYISTLTQSAFFEPDAAGDLKLNSKFGYVKLLSKTADNFLASFTIRKAVTWSDKTSVDATDLLLSWAAAVNLGDAGFKSNLSSTGLAAATDPSLGASGKRLYLKFSHPVADWQYAPKLSVPAHLVAAAAFGPQTDPKAAKKIISDAILNKDSAALSKIATAYNEAFNLTATDFDVTKFATSGAYTLETANNSSVVLKARADCTWCKTATVETVNLNFYRDPAELMDAITAGKVDISESLATSKLPLATLVANLDQLSAKGYQYSTLQSGQIEALVLNYGDGSLFSPTQKRVPIKAADAIKQAFMYLVPRQKIGDSLGIPIKLVRADSFAFLSSQAEHDAVIQTNGSDAYRIQDAEKVSELLKGFHFGSAGKVNILFDGGDLNAQVTFNLINQLASDSNLIVANGSTFDVASVLVSGKYEVHITKITALSISDSAIGAMQNSPSSQKDQSIDSLVAKLAADPNASDRNETLASIDKELFKSGYGLPLYELPKIVVFSGKLMSYQIPEGANSAVSNFDLWSVAPEKQK